jgi:hypothetical protein
MRTQPLWLPRLEPQNALAHSAQKDASLAKTVTEATFIWFFGQLSAGRVLNCPEMQTMAGDGGFGATTGENRFWAVATPL